MSLADAVAYAVAAWPLDEASGDALDQVGSLDLTDNGTVGTGTLFGGNARDFEVDNVEFFRVADDAIVSVTDQDFCIRAQVQLESTSALRGIVAKYSGSGTSQPEYYLIYHNTVNRFRWAVTASDGTETLVDADNLGAPSTGTPYLIHVWHNAATNEIGITINAGTANTASMGTNVPHDGNREFCIGALSQFGQYYDGLIRDVVFLKDYILDATERSEDYNSGSPVDFADWGAGVVGPLLQGRLINGGILKRSRLCRAG